MSIEKVTTTTEQTATGIAHSKLILIGEHAVVHGQPAIAIPFPLVGVESTIEEIKGPIMFDSTFYQGPMNSAPITLEGIINSIEATIEHLQLPKNNLLIRVTSSIPPGKGLGSSASVAIAVIRSLFAYANVSYTEEELLHFANIAETFAHGQPSGIDTLTITSESPVWFEKDQSIQYIKPGSDFHFIVADSGRIGDTRSAVESVAHLLRKAPEKIQRKINRIGDLTHHAKHALEKAGKNFLGQILNEAQKELEALGVSDAGLNKLIDLAREEGALGAKLTGGGNGGCIIALAENEVHSRQLAEKLKKFGAHAVWPFVLRKQN
ncbi:mevalonate kinase [Ornithinibacillus halophilus]|uniref:mevalonate kinase n=1 Tax=Ornithinibacillus halophilus TaxID=930117 RepID=A0A1M5E213_9BACI|nr:mevalonate kinase [Ornithinibacillus halophilus]SHF73287.1 mevalonate kinase [Ornithinibacillus halophilus]